MAAWAEQVWAAAPAIAFEADNDDLFEDSDKLAP